MQAPFDLLAGRLRLREILPQHVRRLPLRDGQQQHPVRSVEHLACIVQLAQPGGEIGISGAQLRHPAARRAGEVGVTDQRHGGQHQLRFILPRGDFHHQIDRCQIPHRQRRAVLQLHEPASRLDQVARSRDQRLGIARLFSLLRIGAQQRGERDFEGVGRLAGAHRIVELPRGRQRRVPIARQHPCAHQIWNDPAQRLHIAAILAQPTACFLEQPNRSRRLAQRERGLPVIGERHDREGACRPLIARHQRLRLGKQRLHLFVTLPFEEDRAQIMYAVAEDQCVGALMLAL